MDDLLTLPTIAGLEHELATISFSKDGLRTEPRAEHETVMDIARQRHPFLWGRRGIYLGNSLNLYEDASNGGAHLEVATPECSTPAELAAHSEAAHRIVQELFEASLDEDDRLESATLYRHSVDYTNGVSWATHLSVLSTQPMRTLASELTAHLVSKLIYAGSGGFTLSRSRADFCLAPRVNTFTCVDSGAQTERDRGLIGGEKDNHCPGGLYRLHFLCHENLCSPLAKYLDAGSTMLIVRLLNAGKSAGLELCEPMRALKVFELDPFCKKTAGVEGGRQMTAVEIQRVYLEEAERHLGTPWMPAWAAGFCAVWRKTLDLIAEAAPWSVSDRLDWAAKYVLFSQHADSRHHGSWARAREGLLELDMRFGQAGAGIFDQMRSSGLLDGDAPGADARAVTEARTSAPKETRAMLRGEWIRKLHAAETPGFASWTQIEDERNGTLLDLHDPWGRDAAWRRNDGPRDIFSRTSILQRRALGMRRRSVSHALRHYEQGRIREAFKATSAMLREWDADAPRDIRQCLECHACSAARLGRDEAFESLAMLEADGRGRTQSLIGHRIFVLRTLSLLPISADIQNWIAESDELRLAGDTNRDPVLLIDLAACYNRLNKPGVATAFLDMASSALAPRTRYHGRALAECGEALRILGENEKAAGLLEKASETLAPYPADQSDHALTYQAKLLGGDAGRMLLQQAITFQRQEETPVAEVRSLLLDSRLGGRTSGISNWKRIRELRETTRALQRDATLDKHVANWQAWISGGDDPEGSGDFYWRL